MDLFQFNKEAPGGCLWKKDGYFIYNKLKDIVWQKFKDQYQMLMTPTIFDKAMWEATGHLSKYQEHIFYLQNSDKLLKPMNCPAHILEFKTHNYSYKNLPIRYFEFGQCFRREKTGGLSGLYRLNTFVQDDGHIICTEKHVIEEIQNFLQKSIEIYNILSIHDINFVIATCPKDGLGITKEHRDAENLLIKAMQLMNLKFDINAEDGAFYGPKIELHIKGVDKYWQCGTIQVDLFLAKNLNAYYIDQNNTRQYPLVLHRATLGSMERFIGIIIERGLPDILNPNLIAIININSHNLAYAHNIQHQLSEAQIDSKVLGSNEHFNIRKKTAIVKKFKYILVVGGKEEENNTINYEGQSISLSQFITNYFSKTI